MGCCGNLDKNQYEMPYEQIEDFNQLKAEIEGIITNNENPYRKDYNKLLELLNKTSIKISEYEEELDKLKNKKNIDKNVPDDFIKGLNSDIKQLKDYYLILDNLIKENDNENESIKLNLNDIQKEDAIKEEITLSNRDKKNDDNLKNINSQNNSNLNKQNDLNLNNTDNIYFKKYVRRNKRSDIFNKKSNQNRAFPQADLFGFPQSENFNFFSNDNGLINKDEITTSEVTNNINNIINIIFVLQNGKKVGIQIKKNDKFLTAIEKLGEKENLKDMENMIILDGEEDITNKVKNGENISSFGFNDYHFIQIKLTEQN